MKTSLIIIVLMLPILCFAQDTQPPDGSLQILPPIQGEFVNFTVSSSDAGIGVSGLCISNEENCSAWQPYSGNPLTVNWQLLPGTGLRTVYVHVKDTLGNTATSRIMVIKE